MSVSKTTIGLRITSSRTNSPVPSATNSNGMSYPAIGNNQQVSFPDLDKLRNVANSILRDGDPVLLDLLYERFNMTNDPIQKWYPQYYYPMIIDYFENQDKGNKVLLQNTLFLNQNSPREGLPYPMTPDILYSSICIKLLNNKDICYDVTGEVYAWDKLKKLFIIIDNSFDLIVFLKQIISNIRMIFSTILDTLDFFYKVKVQLPPTHFEEMKKIYNHLEVNYKVFNKTIGISTEGFTRHIHISLKKYIQLYPQNVIEWLFEQGRPGFLPFKDNVVFDLRYREDEGGKIIPPRFIPREQEHAFCDNCTLLTMSYTSTEFEERRNALANESKHGRICRFVTILWEIANENQDNYDRLIHLFGVCLTATPDKRLWTFYSPITDTGKSFVGRLLQVVLGNKCKSADHKLISGQESSHETEKVLTLTYWFIFMDETERTYAYREKDLQLLTGGPGVMICGRLAHTRKTVEGHQTASLGQAQNFHGADTVRETILPFESAFCADPNDIKTYPQSWWAHYDENDKELFEGLQPKIVKRIIDGNEVEVTINPIRKRDPTLYDYLTNDPVLKLEMLVTCVIAAIDSINNQALNDTKYRSNNMVTGTVPASLQNFLDCPPPDLSKGDTTVMNPYTIKASKGDKLKALVKFNDYYKAYRQFYKDTYGDNKYVSKASVKDVLMRKNLIRSEIYTNFLNTGFVNHIDEAFFKKIINDIFDPLEKEKKIAEGIKQSEIHQVINNYIEECNNKCKDDDHVTCLLKPNEIVDMMTKLNLVSGKGHATEGSFYHIKVKSSMKSRYNYLLTGWYLTTEEWFRQFIATFFDPLDNTCDITAGIKHHDMHKFIIATVHDSNLEHPEHRTSVPTSLLIYEILTILGYVLNVYDDENWKHYHLKVKPDWIDYYNKKVNAVESPLSANLYEI